MIIELRNGKAIVTDSIRIIHQIQCPCSQTCTFDIDFDDGKTYVAIYRGGNAGTDSEADRASLIYKMRKEGG